MRKIEEVEYHNSIDQCGKCGSDRITTQQSKFSGKHFWYGVGIVMVIAAALGLVGGAFGVLVNLFISVLPAIIVGVIAGFIGQGGVINLCGNCGNKWRPGA